MAEYEILHRETGSWGEHDEYWTLVVPKNGAPVVRCDRSWGNPYKGEVEYSPPEITPLKDFLAEHTFGSLHDRLASLLREKGIKVDA